MVKKKLSIMGTLLMGTTIVLLLVSLFAHATNVLVLKISLLHDTGHVRIFGAEKAKIQNQTQKGLEVNTKCNKK